MAVPLEIKVAVTGVVLPFTDTRTPMMSNDDVHGPRAVEVQPPGNVGPAVGGDVPASFTTGFPIPRTIAPALFCTAAMPTFDTKPPLWAAIRIGAPGGKLVV